MTPSRYAPASLLLALFLSAAALSPTAAQQVKPEAWWPVQPVPLPFVHSLFTDDMVLQRDIAAPIWGWSSAGDTISILLDDKPAAPPAVAGADGKWLTRLAPLTAGGPHTLTIAGGKKKITLTNVLVGDVWLCSGQSNMNWPVRLSNNAEEEVKQANHPQIRSFNVPFYPALIPQKLPQPSKWQQCVPEFARDFTGVGYFFAREINQKQQIPVGIIHSSVGATYAEVWVSGEALHREMAQEFAADLAPVDQAARGQENYDYFEALAQWTATVDPASAAAKYSSDPDLNTDDWIDMAVPKPWEEAGLPDHDGLVWFRHWIDIPENWAGTDLRCDLSIIRDCDIIWFNGTLIGASQIGGSIRRYVIGGDLVKPGKNLLACAILNRGGPGGFCSAPQNMAIRRVKGDPNEIVRPAGMWKAKRSTALKDIAAELPMPKVGTYKSITSMYNGMIAPLVPFGIKGALWYQGEANGPRWLQYRRLLPVLIADWRQRFGVGDFPFLIVSLANLNAQQTKPIEPGWAEIRESQWRTARTVPNTGLAMTIDIGDPTNIHPRNKQEVGRRLSLVARHLVYGEKTLVHSGPEFTGMKIEPGGKIRLQFKNIGSGLMIKPGDAKLTGFIIAGEDKNFVWADAVIEGDTIVVSSADVAEPKHVRYGWAWNPIVNLFNKEGLPAITFRTDE